MSLSLEDLEPFTEPLTPFLLDPTVTEIMINEGGRRVFIERRGLIEATAVVLDPVRLRYAIKAIARSCDYETDDQHPRLNAHLADGSRVAVLLPPVAVDGPTISIRKFGERYTLAQLVMGGGVPERVASLLIQAVDDRRNILIVGGTSTGKTTLLNALATWISDHDRIFLIEDNAEIQIKKPNLVRCEAKPRRRAGEGSDQGTDEVTIQDLVADALRFRPDRIILGEVRGAEAWDLLTILNSGHQGSMSTIHGNSAVDALLRLGDFVLMSRVALPYLNILASIARNFQVVVHIDRDRTTGRRHVTEVLALHGYDLQTERFQTSRLYPEATS